MEWLQILIDQKDFSEQRIDCPEHPHRGRDQSEIPRCVIDHTDLQQCKKNHPELPDPNWTNAKGPNLVVVVTEQAYLVKVVICKIYFGKGKDTAGKKWPEMGVKLLLDT